MAIKVEQHGDVTRTFSDDEHWIIQDETGAEYREAWDPIDYPRSYTESDRVIEEEDEPTFTQEELEEAAAMLKAARIMLGGDE